MKIRESKDSPRVIREAKEDAPLRISGREGKRRDRVAMYHEKDNEFIKHGTYRTPGGAYYNRYYVRDEYGDGDELNCKGTVGPFTTEEEAEQAMKDYKPNAVRESFNRKIKSIAKLNESVDPQEFYKMIIRTDGNPSIKDFMSIGYNEEWATEYVSRLSSSLAPSRDVLVRTAKRLLKNDAVRESFVNKRARIKRR